MPKKIYLLCLPVLLSIVVYIAGVSVIYAQSPSNPKSLHPDIQISRYVNIGGKAVRIAQDPVSKNLFYSTFDGEIHQIRKDEYGNPHAVKLFSADDHGITRLQGLTFHDSTMFLVGNIRFNNNLGTKGRIMRGKLQPDGSREWTVVAITAEVGSTKTLYDHGFNAVIVSQDGKRLIFNSGARTDHGEIQDNGGQYPNSRDEALTAVVFDLPIDAVDLQLPNDAAFLAKKGYIFAYGIRNAYDLAYAPNGHLFAVSNSSDYDHPEDMFWLRKGHHYGFPWRMGDTDNPQQNPNWDVENDPLVNKQGHAYVVKYFHKDPTFPKPPKGIKFTQPVQNMGPDANFYRDVKTGKIRQGDEKTTVGTFTAHRSPLGLFFDTDSLLAGEFKGKGFVLSWSNASTSFFMEPFEPYGGDLLLLDLEYRKDADNYYVRSKRIAAGFDSVSDAVLVGNEVFVVEHFGKSSSIWKLTLPKEGGQNRAKK